ncbi:MAG: YihY/virulence factor BrkB family protein [Anaerolineaceae bacterium]|nr:MAG: YihY/virulence factor BrkB family protein [Anaerolineaceae bacterium]
MRILKAIFILFRDAGIAWGQDKASLYAAAIAYYMVFSIAPLLVLSIAIAGRVFGQVAVEGEVVAQVEQFVGPEAAILLQSLLQNAISGSSSFTLISVAILLWAASGVFNHLKRALDIIYGVIPKQLPGLKGALHVIRTRFLTFAMVLFMGVLLLAALAINAVAATLGNFLTEYFPDLIDINTYVTRFIAPFIMFLLFSTLFKMLPEARVAWRDVWLGSLVTTLLFMLGIYIIGIYLSMTNVGSVYGAAGSLIVVLVWIYYSTQILMFGAEFTKIYANRYGRRIVPRRSATSLAEHYNSIATNQLPETEPEPEARERIYFGTPIQEPPEAPAPEQQTRKQIAAGLPGLALGLFLSFIGQFLRDD